MSDQQPEFDWGKLGEEWWRATGKSAGATERQVKFACAKHRGCSNTESARQAGYSGDEDSVRQSAYKTFRTNVVQNLLAHAVAESGDGVDGTVDATEAKRILSGLARGADPNVKIRAVEALQKI